jgi:ABC-2 type transport system ATP-binding protein
MQRPLTQPDGRSPPVEVRELRKVYRDIIAVDGISFALEAGSVTALLGGNGAGKTTTIAMLMGLVVPTSGQARVFGADMTRDRYQVLHRINFESPYVDVPMRLTVRQNLEVFARLYGVRDLKGRIGEIADEFKLTELLDRPYGKLSAGQKTRVSLAKSLLNEPELLMLDEPTASLDPDTADWARTKLDLYRRQHASTIVLASHNMAEVERLADRVIMLEKGRIIADETPTELIKRFGRSNLEEVFLAIARRGTEDNEARPLPTPRPLARAPRRSGHRPVLRPPQDACGAWCCATGT